MCELFPVYKGGTGKTVSKSRQRSNYGHRDHAFNRAAAHEAADIRLANKKGERKASGSYFTPDSVVEYLCRKAIQPKLDACACNPLKILELKLLDPAMGSGHFLVKAIDIIASYLTLNCDPIDEGAPNDNSDREFAYWKEKVAEKCVYGVDYNPMAVELAKVSIWLHTTSAGRPLSFLDHHLKVGNSLIGAPVATLNTPSLKSKTTKQGTKWSSAIKSAEELGMAKKGKKRRGVAEDPAQYQMELPLPIDTSLMSGIVKSIREIVDRIETDGKDVKRKGKDYVEFVERRLAAHKLLADLWCAQWLIFEPDQETVMAYESPSGLYAKVREICGSRDDSQRLVELAKLENESIIRKLRAAVHSGFGPRPLAFFHWQFEFPEVAFDAAGNQRTGFGFDIVLGNPPWDKIKPAKRDFYGPYSEEVANTQGQSLDNLIAELETETPELADGWKR
ncbi:MAG: N-6 DNA methylase, partial [Lentisphaerota bacterium]